MDGWRLLTQLGDTAVTAPAAVAIAALLWFEGERRASLRWAVLFACGSLLVAATKMAFIGWGIGSSRLDFTGASGHAMRAAAIAPVLLHIISRHAPRALRLAATMSGYGFAASIGMSRIVLHAHSCSEVIAGWLIGMTIALCFIALSGASRQPVSSRRHFAAGMAVMLAAAFHAGPAPTQQWLTQASLYASGHEKPFIRAERRSQAASAFSSNWCSAAKSGSPT
ncbi:MAG: phosphatase family protein [Noviherbaspirillum sp.]|nr:phosphatase family protein [Noviherbaspirillum sp.]